MNKHVDNFNDFKAHTERERKALISQLDESQAKLKFVAPIEEEYPLFPSLALTCDTGKRQLRAI